MQRGAHQAKGHQAEYPEAQGEEDGKDAEIAIAVLGVPVSHRVVRKHRKTLYFRLAGPELTPEDRTDRLELHRRLAACVAQLPDPLRAVVNVNTFERIDPVSFDEATTDFDGENLESRLARRARTWISDVTIRTEDGV